MRNLERTIGTLARKAARRIAEGEAKRVRIGERSLEPFLGPERFTPESEGEENLVGVATGMYYTPVGGDILFVETSITPRQRRPGPDRTTRRRDERVCPCSPNLREVER